MPPWVGFAVRPRPGVWEHLRVNVDELVVEELSVTEYLEFKECLSDNNMYILCLFNCSANIHNQKLISCLFNSSLKLGACS